MSGILPIPDNLTFNWLRSILHCEQWLVQKQLGCPWKHQDIPQESFAPSALFMSKALCLWGTTLVRAKKANPKHKYMHTWNMAQNPAPA